MSEVLLHERDGLGLITLNRPKAINALTHVMVQAITSALRGWASDQRIRAIVITGSGDRGLCAGGDIVSMYHDAKDGTYAGTEAFWRDEYILNHLIAGYAKPYVAIMDGIVMGGGVGLSAHGSMRIVTERSVVGMPETGIGFVPDVGGTYLLARAPGELGTHLALTASPMSGADAIATGFADHYVPATRLPDLLEALSARDVAETVTQFATAAPASALAAQRAWIDECYAAGTVEEIAERLGAHPDPAAGAAARQLLSKSPTALKVTLRSLRRAARQSLAAALNEEYRVSLACIRSHDMAEGIRAQVIDKDRTPQWSPASLREVSAAQVEAFFATHSGHGPGLVEAP